MDEVVGEAGEEGEEEVVEDGEIYHDHQLVYNHLSLSFEIALIFNYMYVMHNRTMNFVKITVYLFCNNFTSICKEILASVLVSTFVGDYTDTGNALHSLNAPK